MIPLGTPPAGLALGEAKGLMALHALGREEELKNLQASCAESARATQQVKSPHPDEFLAVAETEFLAGFHECRLPRTERRHIVLAQVVKVLGDE